MIKIIIFFVFVFFSGFVLGDPNSDQWKENKKTYKDLINDGFEIKSYDTLNISTDNGLIILMFVTVLQKNKEVYECQEYQTLDKSMQTLEMSFVCKELVQPYKKGIGT